jgi:outer membrane protein assembly factor BamB
MNFPGQIVNGTGYGGYYGNFQPSTSRTVSLTVQQAPVSGYTEAPVPLPTQYWTEPINAQNRYWSTISGPWLQSGYNATGAFNPYTYAPNSAHIAWKEQLYAMTAGLAGGALGSLQSPGTENAVNSGFSTPIIMEGRMYYNGPIQPLANGTEQYYMYCADLATGKVLWQVPLYPAPGAGTPGASITCGQILNWRTQQMHSALPYIWQITSGLYRMYSAVNGELQAEWHNLPAGSLVANSTAVPAVFGGNIYVPGITTTAVSVLSPAVVFGSGNLVLEQPNPTVVGQDIGGGVGGGALLAYISGRNSDPITHLPLSTGWVACWNSTLAIDSIDNNPVDWPPGDSQGSFNSGIGTGAASYWPTIALQQTTMPLDWNWGIMWNLTVPLVSTTVAATRGGGSTLTSWSIAGADGNYVILQTGKSDPTTTGTSFRTLAAINVANLPVTTTYTEDVGGDTQVNTPATFAWIENYTVPAYDQTFTGTAILEQGGNVLIPDNTVEQVWDFSETTGALLWTSTPFNNDFVMQSLSVGTVANGVEYIGGYDGYMHAINTTNGVQIWESPSQSGGLEMPQPYYPMSSAVVADGKVYTTTLKSYEQQPLFRGHLLLCYDANTGAELWNISGQIPIAAIADGYLVGVNAYDGCVYAFGRGQTATTASATLWGGQNIVISGTVTDQTPTSQAMGTPAISDTWMTPWMEYLYMDQPLPHDATGVPVSIDAVDPNGNFIHIGNATSDITGAYSYQWTPPDIPGKYTIIATFSADNSYYGSSGETAAVVVPAATVVTPTPTPTSVADMYFVPAIAGLAVLIIVGLIVLALLMLRKRP